VLQVHYGAWMIVWVASFPRSGNTFLRIVLHRLYGVRTSTIYDVDGVADRLGADLIGATDRPAALATLRASADVHFVKTHRTRDADVSDDDPAICLVRDGRDALVSWARLSSEDDPARYESDLRAKILAEPGHGTGSWGANVLSWLEPPSPARAILRYEDLIADPVTTVTSVVSTVAPTLTPLPNPEIPTHADLRQQSDPRFFRRGQVGSHQTELPADLHTLFWSRADNRAAMTLLGHE
jgi:hypothetical protein